MGQPNDWNDKRAARYDQRVRELFPEYEELHDRTDAHIQQHISQGSRVLVVGAGTGYEASRLAKLGFNVTGVDPSGDMLALAPQAPGLQYVTGFVSDLPAEPSYDVATCLLVMHFLPEPDKLNLLKDIATRVKPEGHLVLADCAGDLENPEFQATMKAWEESLATRSTPEQFERDLAGIRDKIFFLSTDKLGGLFREAGWEPELLWRPGVLSLWSAVRN